MQCPRCQHENPEGRRFCAECGSSLALACVSCGSSNEAGERFCGGCGAPLSASAKQAETGLGAPASYTPKHLAEKILTSRSALEGERKEVTVLFVDIVESSRLAERLDPEVMHQVMDRALRLMADAVHRYEGTVNQFLGDGLMALFGAPVALEDHAFRAVQGALTIQETMSGYSEQLRQERGVEIRLRMGANSGLVVVGRIGDDLRMDYTAVGDTTNVAARVQALAEPGSIFVTEATHSLIAGYVRSESLGAVQVKGRSEPVSVFKVVGRSRRRSRFEVRADRGLIEFVGRERELAVLRDRLGDVKADRGQVVGIVGEPGVGKSRLLYEFRRSFGGDAVTELEGHCIPSGQATPYLPILEILRTNCQIEEGDVPLQIEEKLRQALRHLAAPVSSDLDRTLPFLREVLGLPDDSDAVKHLDPKDKRQKTFEAIRTLTIAGSRRRPLIVMVEDLQWIDRTSEDFLLFLVDSLATLPVLLLTTHRRGYPVRWADKAHFTEVALDVLAPSEVEAMVKRLLATDHLPPDFIRVVREKAEGNPLFVEEITASLRERGLLVRRNGGILWANDAVVEFPGTIQDIIRARLDRLADPVKRTVQTAAVIGREFGLTVLSEVSEVTQDVQHHLETLKRLELIHEVRTFPEPEYAFKHAVIQDVAYKSLLMQRRTELHGAIARVIEDLSADRLEEQAPVLFYHYARSERGDRAVEYALLAGDRAARLHANKEASSYYEQALARARSLPASPAAQRFQIDATLGLAAVGVTRQDIERDEANLQVARTLAEQFEDRSRLAQILYWLGRMKYVSGDPQTAIGYANESLKIAEQLGDDACAAPPVNLMGRAHYILSEFPKAAPLLERSAEQMRRLGNKNDEATTAALAGLAFALIGEFDRAHPLIDHGVQLSDEIQNPFAQSGAYYFRGCVRAARGEWTDAIADYEHARRMAEGAGDLFRVYLVKCWEGDAYAMAGDPSRGRELLEQGLGLQQQIGTKFGLAQTKAWHAACLLALGDLEAVTPICREAIQLAAETANKIGNALAHRTLSEVLFRLDPRDVEQAEDAIRVAIQLQKDIGMRPELARSYVSYAVLLRAKAENERARELVGNASTMFREMGMLWDLERAERVLQGF